jgi:single-stranded-DNA-specific exonuclease
MDIAADRLRGQELRPTLNIDAEVPLREITFGLYDALRALEPCGHDFEAPVLCARRLRLVEARRVGQDEKHLKLKFSDGQREMGGIAFGLGEAAADLERYPYVDVAYQLSVNEWNDTRRLEMQVQDIRGAQ